MFKKVLASVITATMLVNLVLASPPDNTTDHGQGNTGNGNSGQGVGNTGPGNQGNGPNPDSGNAGGNHGHDGGGDGGGSGSGGTGGGTNNGGTTNTPVTTSPTTPSTSSTTASTTSKSTPAASTPKAKTVNRDEPPLGTRILPPGFVENCAADSFYNNVFLVMPLDKGESTPKQYTWWRFRSATGCLIVGWFYLDANKSKVVFVDQEQARQLWIKGVDVHYDNN